MWWWRSRLGQLDPEAAAAIGRGLDADAPAAAFDDSPYRRQAESDAGLRAARQTHIGLEDGPLLARRNAGTGVLHLDAHPLDAIAAAHGDAFDGPPAVPAV